MVQGWKAGGGSLLPSSPPRGTEEPHRRGGHTGAWGVDKALTFPDLPTQGGHGQRPLPASSLRP